jgi:hypothetical protein
MRKRLIAAVSAVAVLCLGVGIAFAQTTGDNIYEVDIATTKPAGKGSAAKPIPVKLGFGYEVSAVGGLRPTAIKQYRIAPEGLVTYPKLFPTCTFEQANAQPDPSPKCKKADLGSGLVENNFGAENDRTDKAACNLRLRLYNLSGTGKRGGMAIRLDGSPTAERPQWVCPLPVSETIRARFVNVRYQGLRTSELRFDVQTNLYAPVPGVANAVVNVTSNVKKRTARTKVKGKTRTVGYYSKIGCKGRTRAVRVEFVDLENDKSTATKTGRC